MLLATDCAVDKDETSDKENVDGEKTVSNDDIALSKKELSTSLPDFPSVKFVEVRVGPKTLM
jgi:hypothetical protein